MCHFFGLLAAVTKVKLSAVAESQGLGNDCSSPSAMTGAATPHRAMATTAQRAISRTECLICPSLTRMAATPASLLEPMDPDGVRIGPAILGATEVAVVLSDGGGLS